MVYSPRGSEAGYREWSDRSNEQDDEEDCPEAIEVDASVEPNRCIDRSCGTLLGPPARAVSEPGIQDTACGRPIERLELAETSVEVCIRGGWDVNPPAASFHVIASAVG